MVEQQKVMGDSLGDSFASRQHEEEPKLVIVYFANGTKQWVKTGSTNQWARDGGKVHKFYEGKVYTTSSGRKVKMKQHFKHLNAVFMDIETGEFLETERNSLLDLQPHEKSVIQTCKWWEVDWKCDIVFEKKPDKRPTKSPDQSTNNSISTADSSVENN